ncbi:site-specific integrase [Gleimia europaea]|nr:site-specific integrase [Gleimia europaea]WIK62301.1 site-specific integrase [Gleimia europaea]
MPVYKDGNNGTFYVQCYYRDARGSKRHKTKRGFSSEVEAAVWESQFKSLSGGAMDMTFSEFVEVYASEVKPRIREHTWITKEYIINDKLVPFFGDMRMCDVRPIEIVRWQNELTEHRDADGKPWAPTYLRTVNNQLNAIFNHAERYYGLADNPVRRVDKIGSKKGGEMQFWTKDEYLRFSEAVMDKPLSFHAFELLYWTGVRCGELLALTPSDFMLDSSRLRINKSYQSLHGVDTVTDPKTPKSVRTIVMPAFLRDEMADFIEMRDDVAPDERLFAVTKHFLAHEMERGCKASGVKRIRIHDIRHSHVSLLIEMGFSALAIAERMGHEAVDITYRYAHLFPTKQDEMAAALDGRGGKKDAVREQRPQAQQDDGVPLHARGTQAHMRDGGLERDEQAGLHHRQAHQYRSRGEALRERAEGAEGLDGGVGQGGALGGLLRRAERVSAAEDRARDEVLLGARRVY